MKTYCKGLDITSEEHLTRAYDAFARGKRGRREFAAFFSEDPMDVRARARWMIQERTLVVEPIRRFERTEPTNGKTRSIGVEGAMQQYLDYVCVLAIEPLLKAKVGYHQCASVPGKGQHHALRYLKRWARSSNSRYYVKIDVRKYYDSVDRGVLMGMLGRDVRNGDLLWLVGALLETHGKGLSIGSYLSQGLANYYLSGAFRLAEGLRAERRSRRTGEISSEKLCGHVLTYMDDWVFVGRDKSNLKRCVRAVQRYLADTLRLEVKPWKVCRWDCEPLDMVGFVFRRYSVAVRASVFLRARRAFMRAAKTVTPPPAPGHARRRVLGVLQGRLHAAVQAAPQAQGARQGVPRRRVAGRLEKEYENWSECTALRSSRGSSCASTVPRPRCG